VFVGVRVIVGVRLGVRVRVAVRVRLWVRVGVTVRVFVGVRVIVGVRLGVLVRVDVRVAVGVREGVTVRVAKAAAVIVADGAIGVLGVTVMIGRIPSNPSVGVASTSWAAGAMPGSVSGIPNWTPRTDRVTIDAPRIPAVRSVRSKPLLIRDIVWPDPHPDGLVHYSQRAVHR